MTIETKKFSRRPFDVEAVRVTKTNMEGVAEWCKGEVTDVPATDTTKAERFIQVDVHAPANERQSRAFPGDYVLLLEGGKSFKVYTTKAFNKNFVPSTSESEAPAAKKTVRPMKKSEMKPANGIKPEAREALRKMGEGAQKAVETVAPVAEAVKDSVKPGDNTVLSDESVLKTFDDEVTPAAPVELAPNVGSEMSDEEKSERAQVNREAELQVVERPVENTTQPKLEVTDAEPEKPRKFVTQEQDAPKRKFVQQPES